MKHAKSILAIVMVLLPLSANAQQAGKAPKGAPAGMLQLDVIKIVGRVEKPQADIDVEHVKPKLTLNELRQVFLPRIESASKHDPF